MRRGAERSIDGLIEASVTSTARCTGAEEAARIVPLWAMALAV
jgi:hypothetical protein